MARYEPARRTSSSSTWPAEAVHAPQSPASDRRTTAPSTPPPPMGPPPPSWTAEPSTSGWPRHAFARTPVDGLARRPGEGHTRQPTSAHLAEDRQSPLRSRGRSRQVPGVSELINVSPDRIDRHPTSPTNLHAGKHAGAHQVIDPRPAHPQQLRNLVGTQQQPLHDHLPFCPDGVSAPRSWRQPAALMKPRRPRIRRHAREPVEEPSARRQLLAYRSLRTWGAA
jgi:hypothetical protein